MQLLIYGRPRRFLPEFLYDNLKNIPMNEEERIKMEKLMIQLKELGDTADKIIVDTIKL